MRQIHFLVCSVLLTAGLAQAGDYNPDKIAEGARLTAKLDAQAQKIAMMETYAARLREMLHRAGVDVPRPTRKLTTEQKLQQVLPRMHCDHVTLINALAGLSRFADLKIAVDWKALASSDVTPAAVVNCDERACSVSDALRTVFSSVGVTDVQLLTLGDIVQITTYGQMEKFAATRTFDIGSLLPRDDSFIETRERIEKLVVDTVAPESWLDAGGSVGTVSSTGTRLIVKQLPENLDAVGRLLDQLDIDKDNARIRSSIREQESSIAALCIDIEHLTASCRSVGIIAPARLDVALDEVLPDVQFVAAPLSSCVDWLRQTSGQIIHVNWESLQKAEYSPRSPVTLSLRHETLSGALRALLQSVARQTAPLQFGTERNTITIATAEEFNKASITRVYDIRDLVLYRRASRQEMVDELIKGLVDSIEPDSWRDAGGTMGSIRELQGQLIITQSERAHQRIKRWLAAVALKMRMRNP